jgi:hypothetical protein
MGTAISYMGQLSFVYFSSKSLELYRFLAIFANELCLTNNVEPNKTVMPMG